MTRYKDYTFKIIKSGNVTEIYAYRELLYKKVWKETIEAEKDTTQLEQEVKEKGVDEIVGEVTKIDEKEYTRRKADILQTKRKLTRLIQSNVGQWNETDKFLTLTFEGKPPTRQQVVDDFKYFNKKFKRKYGDGFEYIAVIERGEQGTKRLHLHIVCFNLPYVDHREIAELWGKGFVYINAIDEIGDVATYMTKYIDKTLHDNYIGKGQRFYFPSKNLKKPQEIFLNDNEIEHFINYEDIGFPTFEFGFNSQYVGECMYTKFLKIDND